MTSLPAGAPRRRPLDEGSGSRPFLLRIVGDRRRNRSPKFLPKHRLAIVSVGLLVSVCLLVAAAQAVVASRQIRIDDLRQQLATAVAANENLEVQRAALIAPARILSIAEHRLGMTSPKQITYLVPVQPSALEPPSKAATR